MLVLLLSASCSTVELPSERFYRLAYPTPDELPAGRAGVLRIDRLELATHLRGDRIMVAEGPVSVRPYQYHRWAGPLEAMVEDVLVTGLERSRAFAEVKGPGARGGEQLVLSGRVLELQQQVEGGQWRARVLLDLQLVERSSGQVVFRDEFGSDVPVMNRHPESVVAGLSEGLARVVTSVVARAREAGVFAGAAAPPK